MYLVNHSFDENKEKYILWTIQGEGERIGTPSMFIRLGGCNLNCKGFGCKYFDFKTKEEKKGCDSWYAVDLSYKETWKYVSNLKDLLLLIKKTKPKNFTNNYDVVITGGEPLIYWNEKIFQDFLEYFILKKKKRVVIETNGTISIKFNRKYQKKIIFSISPKLSNSGESLEKRFKPLIARNYLKNAKGYLKFVVSRKDLNKDLKEIDQYLEYFKNMRKLKIYLMPIGETFKKNKKQYEEIIDICKQKGFIFNPRLHIIIWDKKKGV